MFSPYWKENLDSFLDGQKEVRFESKKRYIYYPCRYKIYGRWRRAEICFETGAIKIRGKIVRRCNKYVN